MAEKITKLQRWLDLIAFLAARRFPVPMEDIWAGVADPHWVVGHALNYGAEAEILEPEELRALVRGVVEGMAG